MTHSKRGAAATIVFALALVTAGCLGGTTPVPRLSVTVLTDGEVNGQPNWTVGWAFEVFESIGENITVDLSATVPAGWTHQLLRTNLSFAKANDRRDTFLLVNVPATEANGSYDVTIRATTGADSAQAVVKVKLTKPTSGLLKNGTGVGMDYVGFLADNHVFDTSVWNVANSSGLDKWPDFKNSSASRTQADYNPLDLTLGKQQVIRGWEIGLQGMALAQSKVLIIPPELAYGSFRDQPLSLTEVLSIYNTTSLSSFQAYTGFAAVEHAQFIDPIYGWTIEVVSVDSTTQSVTFRNMPSVNASYTPYGINATVANLSTALGTFEVHYAPLLNQATRHQGTSGVVDQLNATDFNLHWQTNNRQSLAPLTLYFLVYVRSTKG